MVRGKAEAPVWISVVNDQVTFNDATDLWGLDTFECQERIWEEVTHGTAPGSWYELTKDARRPNHAATVRHLHRTCRREPGARVVHRARCRPRDGTERLRAVFGAKNLKAMSFIGSKSIPIADPAALVRLRLEVQEKFGYASTPARFRARRQPGRRIHRAGHEPHGVARRRMPRLLQELP